MSSGGWNHRVITRYYEEHNERVFKIHECYYKEREDTIPYMHTENAIAAYGETAEELKECLGRMLAACEKPILVEEDDKLVEWKA